MYRIFVFSIQITIQTTKGPNHNTKCDLTLVFGLVAGHTKAQSADMKWLP